MARYKDAIKWITENDDTEFLNDGEDAPLSVTACMVADLFGKDDEQVRADLVDAKRRDRALRSAQRMHSIGA